VATEVVLPMLGITVEKGTIVRWLKSEGDYVEKGEVLFEVETNKVTTEVESPASGILRKILVPEGREVDVLTVVGVITAPEEELPVRYRMEGPTEGEAQASTVSGGPTGGRRVLPDPGSIRAVPAARRLAREKGLDLSRIRGTGPDGMILYGDVASAVEAKAPQEEEEEVKASTLARRLARQRGISLKEVKGSGVRGRIMRKDVLRVMEQREAAQQEHRWRPGQTLPMTGMRRTIASRMTESARNAPHIHLFADVRMDPLLELRSMVLEDFQARFGLRPSINDFLIKAVALILREMPILNASVRGEEIYIPEEIHIGLAVALSDGLIVPAIPHADRLGLAEIASIRKDLVERARQGRLTVEEVERGTFTLSSLAQYEVSYFTAILNPPQCGLLTVGCTRETWVLGKDGRPEPRSIATFGLTVDHRVVDGAVAAEFLQRLKRCIEGAPFRFLHLESGSGDVEAPEAR